MRMSILIFLLIVPVTLADVSVEEKKHLQENIQFIVDAVNHQDFQALDQIISPNAPGIKTDIENWLAGKNAAFQIATSDFKELENNQVLVTAGYSFTSAGATGSGIGAYFIFEKTPAGYLLVNTNFYKFVSFKYTIKYFFTEYPASWIKPLLKTKLGLTKAFTTAFVIFLIITAISVWLLNWLVRRYEHGHS